MKDNALLNHTLALADDALVLGHRLSEWCGKAHSHEEDLALANIGLDLIGQARSLYAYTAQIDGTKSEDDFAFQRNEADYKNLLIYELPNGDFAFTIARLFLCSVFMHAYWQAMTRSCDQHLAALAKRAEKEVAYHVRHAADWVLRLGRGTHESATRLQAAFAQMPEWTGELFAMDHDETQLMHDGLVPDRAALHQPFEQAVSSVLVEAGIEKTAARFQQSGGRHGHHTEHLGYLLAEMQVLARRDPQAVW